MRALAVRLWSYAPVRMVTAVVSDADKEMLYWIAIIVCLFLLAVLVSKIKPKR